MSVLLCPSSASLSSQTNNVLFEDSEAPHIAVSSPLLDPFTGCSPKYPFTNLIERNTENN